MFYFCQYFTRILTDGCSKGRRKCWFVNKIAPALQFYLALLIISLKFHCHSNPSLHARTNPRTWMLVYRLGFLPSLLYVLLWPARAALGNNSHFVAVLDQKYVITKMNFNKSNPQSDHT